MNTIYHCEVLAGKHLTDPIQEIPGILPEAEMDVYRKLASVRFLGTMNGDPIAEASLCRGSLSTQDDDRVRIACLQELVNRRSSVLEVVLLALLFDDDMEVVKAAVEGMILFDPSLIRIHKDVITHISVDLLNAYVVPVLADVDVALYKLDP